MLEKKANVLIVDDSQLNRMLLCELLSNQYNILEAENGKKAIEIIKNKKNIDLILLDIIMPELDGYGVLEEMKKMDLLEFIPVIIISSDGNMSSMERAYELGATDYIKRPFESYIINRRIKNTLMLYEKQKKLMNLVEEQIQQRVSNNTTLINVLGHIVEFRNGESGLHIQHIQTITKMLLLQLSKKSNDYHLSDYDILLISTASSLHDIGKISIDEKILNKPGRLTPEEFEIIKQHSVIGAEMLKAIPNYKNNKLLEIAYQICRWHHERFDGHGYPDGLEGDNIPISAQVVSLADVYDALTSERCYKKAYSHEQAMNMILDGQCGAFNPILLECLCDIEEEMKENLFEDEEYADQEVVSKLKDELVVQKFNNPEIEKVFEEKTLNINEINEITFEYDAIKDAVYISSQAAQCLSVPDIIYHPLHEKLPFFRRKTLEDLSRKAHQTTQENPSMDMKVYVHNEGEKYWYRFLANTLWKNNQYVGIIGKIVKDTKPEVVQYIDENKILKYSFEEMAKFVEELKKVFAFVRLINVEKHEVSIIEDGKMMLTKGHCFDFWDRKDVCVNCISKKAMMKKGQAVKLEFLDHDVYGVIAQYVEIDSKPWVLEILCKTREDILLGAHGKSQFLEKIVSYNRQYFKDVLTETYSRRYYEEYAKYMTDIDGVAMIDADDFKNINDHYGHAVGDMAIKSISNAIQSCIRSTDLLIRYGGDEFVLVLLDIPLNSFIDKLNKINERVQQTVMEGYEDVHLSITIGAVYGVVDIEEGIHQADQLMYKGKKSMRHVVLENNKEL